MKDEITLRAIQHYMYCPHRWGLIEIGQVWAENLFVTKANILHKRVHDPEKRYTEKGKKVFTAVPVYNDLEDYNLYGVTDCLEFTEDSQGMQSVAVVEYKPTAPKNNLHREEDVMQVFAQKLCVDYTFKCKSEAFLYYADIRRRYKIDFTANYKDYERKLKVLLKEMRDNMEKGAIPPIRKGQKCSGCSMKDLCMPNLKVSKSSAESFAESLSERLAESPEENVAESLAREKEKYGQETM